MAEVSPFAAEIQRRDESPFSGEIEKRRQSGDQDLIDRFRQRSPGLAGAAERTLLGEEKRKFLEGELVSQGVDIESGGPAGVRAELSLTPVERQEIVLNSSFGEGGWRHTDLGVVVTLDAEGGPQEVLLDETGLSLKDFADMAGSSPEIAGSVAAAVAVPAIAPGVATGGTLSLLGYAAFVAAAGQITGGASDLAFSIKNGGFDFTKSEDRDLLVQIAKRRGVNAAVDTLLDFATAGGARLISPKARAMQASPQREIAEAASRRDVPLSVGEATGSKTFMRTEALTEKVPGATGPAVRLQEKTTTAMRGAVDDVVGQTPDARDVGGAFSANLNRQFDDKVAEIEALRNQAMRLTDHRIQDLQKRMATRSLSSSEAGEMARRTLMRERARFRRRQTVIEDQAQAAIDELPEGQAAFVPALDIKATALKLKDEFPKNAKGKPIDEFLAPELKRFFSGVDKLPDNMTVRELRNLRTIIANAIDDDAALPGVGQGILKQLEAATTRALRDGVDKAPNEDIAFFLGSALEHYRVNNSKFRTGAIARIFRTEERAGFVENEDVLPGLMKRNRVEDVNRVLNVIGHNSIAAKVARRSVFEDMIHASQNSLLKNGTVDPKRLAREFDKLSPAMRGVVFGESTPEVGQLIRLMAARGGDFDLSGIVAGPGTKKINDLLRDAAAKELSVRADFERGIIKPILRGELGVSNLAPEDFVRHTLKTGSLDDVQALFRLAPPELQDAFRKRSIIQILEMSEAAGREATDKIVAFSRNGADPSEKILDVMRRNFGPDSKTSLDKLRLVLGEEGFSLIKDMGIISAARARKADAAKAVGGLVGGSIMSRLLTLELSSAASIAKYRLVSVMLRTPATRAWLTNDLIFKGNSAAQSLALVLPQLTRAVTAEFGEGSETATEINDFLTDPLGFRKLVESTLEKK